MDGYWAQDEQGNAVYVRVVENHSPPQHEVPEEERQRGAALRALYGMEDRTAPQIRHQRSTVSRIEPPRLNDLGSVPGVPLGLSTAATEGHVPPGFVVRRRR